MISNNGQLRLHASAREGLSLLEVILAIAILGVAMAAIGELVRLGSRSAAQARDLTTAQLLCESKSAELAAGIEPIQSLSGTPFDNENKWVYSIEIGEVDQDGLVAVAVLVQQNVESAEKPVSFSLVRWIKDPGVVFEDDSEGAASAGDADE